MGKKPQPGSYRAVLAGGRIEWVDEPPTTGPVEVRVSLLPGRPEPAMRRAAAVEALERLASLGGVPSIDDPSAWQREQRGDRRLPGRPA